MAKKVQSNGDISMWSEQHQESVLYSILTDQEFGSKFLTGLGEVGTVYQNSFQNECMKWLLVKVLEYYNEKDLIPSPEYLRFTIENEYANTKDDTSRKIAKEECTAILDRIMNTPHQVDELESIKANVRCDIRTTLATLACREYMDYAQKRTTSNEDGLTGLIEKLINYDRKSDFDRSFAEQITEGSLYKDLVNNKVEIVPTNSKFINEMLGGGIRKKEICIFGMSSGTGKSCISSGMAVWVANLGYKVLHITLEDLDTSIKAKYASIILDKPASEIEVNAKDYKDLFESERFKNFERKCNENLQTIYASKNNSTDFTTAEFDPLRIDKELTKLKYLGFEPDLLIIDYYDRLVYRTTNKLKEGDEAYTATKLMSQLDWLAKKWNVAMFVPSQLTKEGDTKHIKDCTSLDISGGKKKKDFCQSMFIMKNDNTGDFNDKLIKVLKSRHKFADASDIYSLKFNNNTCLFDNKAGYKLWTQDLEDTFETKTAKEVINQKNK